MYFDHIQPLYYSFLSYLFPFLRPTHYIWGKMCHICLSEDGLFHLMWRFPVSLISLQIISFFFKSSSTVPIGHIFLPRPLASTQDDSVSWLLYILHQLQKYMGIPIVNWPFFFEGGCYILKLDHTLVLFFSFGRTSLMISTVPDKFTFSPSLCPLSPRHPQSHMSLPISVVSGSWWCSFWTHEMLDPQCSFDLLCSE